MADSSYIQYDTESQQGRKVRLIDNGDGTYSLATVLKASSVVGAGKKTDADATDKTITTTGFNRVILDCSDCPVEMTFTIDEAISGAEKPIYIKAGASLDLPASGTVLHYSGAGTFRYILV